MQELTTAALIAFTLALLGIAGANDFEDAKASEAAYCERVSSGTHTDYLNISEVCNDRY